MWSIGLKADDQFAEYDTFYINDNSHNANFTQAILIKVIKTRLKLRL